MCALQTKSYDQHTTVLQCVTKAIKSSDPDCLAVENELSAVGAASKTGLDVIEAELRQLRGQVGTCDAFLSELSEHSQPCSSEMFTFVAQAMVCAVPVSPA